MKVLLVFLFMALAMPSLAFAGDKLFVLNESEGRFLLSGLQALGVVNAFFIEYGIYYVVVGYGFFKCLWDCFKSSDYWNFAMHTLITILILGCFVKPGSGNYNTGSIRLNKAVSQSDEIVRARLAEEGMNEEDISSFMVSQKMDADLANPPEVFMQVYNAIDAMIIVLMDLIDDSLRDSGLDNISAIENSFLLSKLSNPDIVKEVDFYNKTCFYPAISILSSAGAIGRTGGLNLKKNSYQYEGVDISLIVQSLSHPINPKTLSNLKIGKFGARVQDDFWSHFMDAAEKAGKSAEEDSVVPETFVQLDCAEQYNKMVSSIVKIIKGMNPGDPLRIELNKYLSEQGRHIKGSSVHTNDSFVDKIYLPRFYKDLIENRQVIPQNRLNPEMNPAIGTMVAVFSWFKSKGDAIGVQAFIYGLPYVNGIALTFCLAVFPFIVCYSLYPGKAPLLLEYFKNILWVKSWIIPISIGSYMAKLIEAAAPEQESLILTSIYASMMGAPIISYFIIKAGNSMAGMAMGANSARAAQQMGGQVVSAITKAATSAAGAVASPMGGAALGMASKGGGMMGKAASAVGSNMRGMSRAGFQAAGGQELPKQSGNPRPSPASGKGGGARPSGGGGGGTSTSQSIPPPPPPSPPPASAPASPPQKSMILDSSGKPFQL